MDTNNHQQEGPNEFPVDVSSSYPASRWSRLWAFMLDTSLLAFLLLPIIYFTGGLAYFAQGIQPPFGYNLSMAICSVVIFFIINGNLLQTKGQTIGKRILGIKIVDLQGNLPTVKEHLLPRYLVFFLPGQIPVIGGVFNFLDSLFIFSSERRCLHDLAAKTKVVNVS